jgi:ribulose-5-phosphate 4-epimerase/fuculose-1-phosphate aldolase
MKSSLSSNEMLFQQSKKGEVPMSDDRAVSIEMEQRSARIDLAAAFHLAAKYDFHEAIDNHFTLNTPGTEGNFYLNSYGYHWTEITASSLLEVNCEGRIVSGKGIADQAAICIHGPIHRLIPDARCVLHTHMPFATALTQLEDMTLELTGQSALYLLDKVAYYYDYEGIVDSPREGERMAAAMGDKPILMLANHGVLVTGKTVAQAFDRLYFLERSCRTQLYSMWTLSPRRFVTPQVIERTRNYKFAPNPGMDRSSDEYHFDAMKRILDRECSIYAQ